MSISGEMSLEGASLQGSAHNGLSVTGAVAMVDIRHYIRRVKIEVYYIDQVSNLWFFMFRTETTTVLYDKIIAGIKWENKHI